MRYTREGIMAQIFVALGQGSGIIRIHHDACLDLHQRYYERITDEVVDLWETEGTQVLERIRAIGRLAAARTIEQGATAIEAAVLIQSARQVESASGTTWCPVNPPIPP